MDRNSPASSPQLLGPAVAYFGLVFSIGFVLGAIRVSLLVPRIGVRLAELLEMPVMIAASIWSARFVVRRFDLPTSHRVRLQVGVMAFALLVGAEFAFAYYFQGLSPLKYIASRDVVSGPIYIASLALFAVLPMLVLRRSNPSLERP